MYEGTAEEMIIPLSYERDALYIDYRPPTAEEQVQFVRANPLPMEDWSLGESQHHLREPIREVLEVQRQECEVWRSSTSATHQRRQKSSSGKRQHQPARSETNAHQSTS
jgi:hypothetical protein